MSGEIYSVTTDRHTSVDDAKAKFASYWLDGNARRRVFDRLESFASTMECVADDEFDDFIEANIVQRDLPYTPNWEIENEFVTALLDLGDQLDWMVDWCHRLRKQYRVAGYINTTEVRTVHCNGHELPKVKKDLLSMYHSIEVEEL